MEDNQKEEVLDQEALSDVDKSFNGSLDELIKAINGPTKDKEESEEDLEKAGDSKTKKAPKNFDSEPENEEEAEEEEEEEEEGKKVKKSVEEMLDEDVEAQASMDVEPFLRTLVKSVDEAINGLGQTLQKAIDQRFEKIEPLIKAQGKAQIAQMELSKSQSETVKKIAKQDQKVLSIQRLGKSRFEPEDGEPIEVSGPEVLIKSRDWLAKQQIDLLEAGMIEVRVNKGMLGQQNDVLDQKVMRLIKEAS